MGRARRSLWRVTSTILDMKVGRELMCSVWFQTGKCERPTCRMMHEWAEGAEQAARDYVPTQAIRDHFEHHGVDFKVYFDECLKERKAE